MQNTTSMCPQGLRRQADEMEQAGRTFLEAAAKMRETADLLERMAPQSDTSSNGTPREHRPAGRRSKASQHTPRLRQLTDWLREHGPLMRVEVLQGCGIPKGTAGAFLTKKHFTQALDGRWSVQEEDSKPAK